MQKGYTDVSLETLKDDILNIGDYVHSLKEFILQCDTPMTIAIQGEWGSGKTSMMNMIKKELENDKVLLAWFNTWQYSQFEMNNYLSLSLLSNFLETIEDKNKKNSIRDKVVNLIGTAASKVAIYGIERVAGQEAAKDVRGLVEDTKVINALDSLKMIKDEIGKAIKTKLKDAEKEKYIIFIDDLDRLDPKVAVELLEVIKIFLDIEKCVFVLALDYDVVVRGLRNKFGNDFEDYKAYSFFEKIIQLPFGMPIGFYDIKKYLTQFIDSKSNCENRVDQYVNLINCSIGFNPRRIKRLFNMFILLLEVANKNRKKEKSDEFNEDEQDLLFAIICMQLEFKEIYNYFLKNRELIDKDMFDSLRSEGQLRENSDLVEEIWGNKYKSKEDKMIFKRTAKFVQALWNTINRDNDEVLSEEEIEAFMDILCFSSITSVNTGLAGDDKTSGRTSRITYTKFDEFVDGQSEDPLKKRFMPIARKVHELIIEALEEQNLPYEVRYGGGTFSFSVPKDNAKSKKRSFARCGLLDHTLSRTYFDYLYIAEGESLPEGAQFMSDGSSRCSYDLASLEDFEKVKQALKKGVVKSYRIIAK